MAAPPEDGLLSDGARCAGEGDDGDGKEPKPEEEIELLVHNVVRENTHSLEDLLMATTAKLRG